MMQFSLRRLLLGVTVVAVVAALARVAPGAVMMALVSAGLSLACLAITIRLVQMHDQGSSFVGVGCLGLVAIPAFGFGVAFGLNFLAALARAIVALLGG